MSNHKYDDFKTVKQVFDWPITEIDPATWTEDQLGAVLIAINLHDELMERLVGTMNELEGAGKKTFLGPEYLKTAELMHKMGVDRRNFEPK